LVQVLGLVLVQVLVRGDGSIDSRCIRANPLVFPGGTPSGSSPPRRRRAGPTPDRRRYSPPPTAPTVLCFPDLERGLCGYIGERVG
jgi:hypothetical protein